MLGVATPDAIPRVTIGGVGAGSSHQDPDSADHAEGEPQWKWEDAGFRGAEDDDLAEVEPPSGLEFAGFGIRAGARVIDILTYNAIAIFTMVFVGAVIAAVTHIPVAPLTKRLAGNRLVGYTAAILASCAYHIFCEGIHGSTLGKLVLGLRVIGEEDKPCGMGGAFIRTVGFFVDGLFFAIPAYVSMNASPERRRIGDKWAHTRVVRRRSLPPDQRRTWIRLFGGLVAGGLAYSLLFTLGLLLKLWLTSG